MLTWIYRIIVVLVAVQVVVCMFHEKSWKKQFNPSGVDDQVKGGEP